MTEMINELEDYPIEEAAVLDTIPYVFSRLDLDACTDRILRYSRYLAAGITIAESSYAEL